MIVGRDAVDWLARNEGLSRADAVRLGQALLEHGAIHHVLDEHPFRDADLFYRFRVDDIRADDAFRQPDQGLLTKVNDWR